MAGEGALAREERGTDAKSLLDELKQHGLGMETICEALEGRVSKRTIYRWVRGDTNPQRGADVDALREVHSRLLKNPS